MNESSAREQRGIMRRSTVVAMVMGVLVSGAFVAPAAFADTDSDTDLRLEIPPAGELSIFAAAQANFGDSEVNTYLTAVDYEAYDSRNPSFGSFTVSGSVTDLRGPGVIGRNNISPSVLDLVVSQGDGTASFVGTGGFDGTAKPLLNLSGATTVENRVDVRMLLTIPASVVEAAPSGAYSGVLTLSIF